MLPRDLVPSRVLHDIRRFQFDNGTVKVDWTLDGPIPWIAPAAAGAGTVHLARDMDHLTDVAGQMSKRLFPSDPYLIMGQMTMTDPTRSPAGTETVWAYSHVPQRPVGDAGNDGLTGRWDERETELYVRRMEDQVEQLAPGFRDRVRGRHVMTPHNLHGEDGNLVAGALGGGTTQLHQQLVFRPIPGLAGTRTFLRGLYLASSSTHPGGGVHGANGGNAARAALQDASPVGTLRRVAVGAGRALDRRMQQRQRVPATRG
jgi:phytoene dehydrogenase-like protein